MNQWLYKIPDLNSADRTEAVKDGAPGARREEFWTSMAALPSDPFFEITSGAESVSVTARKARTAQSRP